MKPEKMKSVSEAKVRCGFPKIKKFHFCPVFGASFYNFIHNFIVRFMHKDDVNAT